MSRMARKGGLSGRPFPILSGGRAPLLNTSNATIIQFENTAAYRRGDAIQRPSFSIHPALTIAPRPSDRSLCTHRIPAFKADVARQAAPKQKVKIPIRSAYNGSEQHLTSLDAMRPPDRINTGCLRHSPTIQYVGVYFGISPSSPVPSVLVGLAETSLASWTRCQERHCGMYGHIDIYANGYRSTYGFRRGLRLSGAVLRQRNKEDLEGASAQ